MQKISPINQNLGYVKSRTTTITVLVKIMLLINSHEKELQGLLKQAHTEGE